MGESSTITDHLRQLHDEYVFRLNSALQEGRDDLVGPLADAYTDDALRILTTV